MSAAFTPSQRASWLKWLLEKEQSTRKQRAAFEDIEGAYVLSLYDADLKIIEELQAFIFSLPHSERLREDLAQAQRWIRKSRGRRLDYACAACFPSGDLVQPGFICAECKAHEVQNAAMQP